MNEHAANIEGICPRREIAAYVDGELSPRAELALEMHLAVCPVCAEELNVQKKLLSALDFALEDDRAEIELPANFTKVVVANAESKVNGLRCPRERSRALMVCAGLFLLLVFGLGAEMPRTFAAFGTIGEKFLAVGAFFVHLVHDMTIAATVIIRSLCAEFVFKSAVSMIAIGFFFVLSLWLLSRLLLRPKRF